MSNQVPMVVASILSLLCTGGAWAAEADVPPAAPAATGEAAQPAPQPAKDDASPSGQAGAAGTAGATEKTDDKPQGPASKKLRRTIFSAPMENGTGQEQYDPVAAGLGDLVAVMLAQQDDVIVVERQRLEALTKEQALSLKGLTDEKYAVQAGKLLEADTVLTGRLFVVKGQLTVSVKALDIATARVVGAQQLTCRPEDVLETALQLSRELAKQMSWPLPEIDLTAVDKSPLAALHFAKALSRYYAGNLDEALMQFMRAIDLDPDYVDVHYWSGLCYQRQGEWPHAVIEWEKFLKRAPNSSYAPGAKKLLEEAKARAAAATPPGQPLGPRDEPQSTAQEAH